MELDCTAVLEPQTNPSKFPMLFFTTFFVFPHCFDECFLIPPKNLKKFESRELLRAIVERGNVLVSDLV